MATRSRQRPPATPAKRHKPADDRWELFASEYVKDHNIRQAAIRSGFPPAGAAVQGGRLLKKVHVINRVAELERKVIDQNQLEVTRLVQETQKIAFSDVGQMLKEVDGQLALKPLSEIDTSVLSHLELVTTVDLLGKPVQVVKVKPHNKLQAIQTLMRHLGALAEHVEVTGKKGGPIEVDGAGIAAAVAKVLPKP